MFFPTWSRKLENKPNLTTARPPDKWASRYTAPVMDQFLAIMRDRQGLVKPAHGKDVICQGGDRSLKYLNSTNMELISGFLLWTSEVIGIKWVNEEKNPTKRVLKTVVFLVAGFVSVVGAFALLY